MLFYFCDMDFKQLKKQNKGLLLYDISTYRGRLNYRTYKSSLVKGGKLTDRLRTCAPFGSGVKADLYYFDNTNIVTPSGLKELGFKEIHSQYYVNESNGFTIEYKIVNGTGTVYINQRKTKVKTISMLHDLIMFVL